MDRRPTPDPGSTETPQGEPGYAAARRHLQQQPIPENEGLDKATTRGDAPSDVERPAEDAEQQAAQRGRTAN